MTDHGAAIVTLGTCQNSGGVYPGPVTHNLAQHLSERQKEKKREFPCTHPQKNDRFRDGRRCSRLSDSV